MKSFIALVTPFDPSLKPDQGLPKPQPPAGGPRPDQGLPGEQPKPDHGYLPHPEHPIYYPLPPGAPVYPDQGLPGSQPGIDNTLPGSQPKPDNTLPGSQPKPDQGLPGPQPKPEHPIVLPPGEGGWEPIYIWGPGDGAPDAADRAAAGRPAADRRQSGVEGDLDAGKRLAGRRHRYPVGADPDAVKEVDFAGRAGLGSARLM